MQFQLRITIPAPTIICGLLWTTSITLIPDINRLRPNWFARMCATTCYWSNLSTSRTCSKPSSQMHCDDAIFSNISISLIHYSIAETTISSSSVAGLAASFSTFNMSLNNLSSCVPCCKNSSTTSTFLLEFPQLLVKSVLMLLLISLLSLLFC
jgi:hypothetical protein